MTGQSKPCSIGRVLESGRTGDILWAASCRPPPKSIVMLHLSGFCSLGVTSFHNKHPKTPLYSRSGAAQVPRLPQVGVAEAVGAVREVLVARGGRVTRHAPPGVRPGARVDHTAENVAPADG